MVYCEVCEVKVQEGGNYCYNCGAGVESFENGKSKYKFTSLDHNCERNFNIAIFDSSLVIFLDPEREIFERYFHLGYKCDVSDAFLSTVFCNNALDLRFHYSTILNVKLKKKLKAP